MDRITVYRMNLIHRKLANQVPSRIADTCVMSRYLKYRQQYHGQSDPYFCLAALISNISFSAIVSKLCFVMQQCMIQLSRGDNREVNEH